MPRLGLDNVCRCGHERLAHRGDWLEGDCVECDGCPEFLPKRHDPCRCCGGMDWRPQRGANHRLYLRCWDCRKRMARNYWHRHGKLARQVMGGDAA